VTRIDPASLLVALARRGFRGPVASRCVSDLVRQASDDGLDATLDAVEDDTGLTAVATDPFFVLRITLGSRL
jgi:hypothetical protein